MAGFLDGLTGSAWSGRPAAPRAGTSAGRPDGQQAGSAFAGWVWRWRLPLAVPAVAVPYVLATRVPWAQLYRRADWQARSGAARVGDRWPAPDGPAPSDWQQPAVHAVVWAACLAAVWLVVSTRPAGGDDTGSSPVARLRRSRLYTTVGQCRWVTVVRRERGWRTCRLVERRWEQAMWDLGLTSKRRLGRWRAPRLDRVKVTEWGGFTGRVTIPRGFKVGLLVDDSDNDQLIRRELDLEGRLGVCEQLVWHTPQVNGAKWRQVDLVFQGLPDPGSLPVDLRAAPDDSTLRVLVTRRGFLGWNLDQQPFLRLSGRSGAGKGFWLRWQIAQAVQRGWLVCIICGAGAPEHARWQDLPNVMYYPLDIDQPAVALARFREQLHLFQRLAAHRRRVCLAEGEDDWKSLPWRIRRHHPRVLIVFDEFTALVGKAKEEPEVAELRQAIGFLINRMLRLYRKYGMNAVLGDQITYAATYVGADGLAQATQYVFCGRANDTQRRMVSQGTVFPAVPNLPGFGVGGVTGEPEATDGVWPPTSGRDVLGLVAAELAMWEQELAGV